MMVLARIPGGTPPAHGADGETEIAMGMAHINERAVPAVLAAREAGRVIDDLTASMIVDAFTGSWATCEFAATGNFAVSTECLPSTVAGEVYGGKDPVVEMDHHLWHWTDHFTDIWDEGGHVPMLREAMRDYMAARWRDGTGECGRIEGWPTRPWA
jgi:hypothetical protein